MYGAGVCGQKMRHNYSTMLTGDQYERLRSISNIATRASTVDALFTFSSYFWVITVTEKNPSESFLKIYIAYLIWIQSLTMSNLAWNAN